MNESQINKFKIPILESNRLKLTPLSMVFATEKYVNWMNDPEVIKYLMSGGNYTIDKLQKYIEEVEKRPQFFWAISLKETKEHVGNIKIDPIDPINLYGEYGIMIGDKSIWGKGIAYEASSKVISHCFEKLKLRKINLSVLSKNLLARKLYNSLGFEQEGYFKKHIFHNNQFEDSIRMTLFNKNFKY